MSRRLTIRTARGGLSVRMALRPLLLALILAAASGAAICLATAFGEYRISLWSVIRVLSGGGNTLDSFVILQLRLPRIIEGALVGAALGLSGGIFQLLTRNPLASPDLLGINEGAAVVAVWMILLGAPGLVLPLGAFLGALAATLLVGLIALPRGFSIYRIILVGIGINALCAAAVAYLIAEAPASLELNRVQSAQQWLMGSLSGSTWPQVRLIGAAVLLLAPVACAAGRSMNVLQLGDDLAATLGLRTVRLQIGLAAIAALLAATAVSVAGPIGFVAFIAPHIARRLARTPGAASLSAAMGVGALLLIAADYLAERLLEPTELPVGIVTVILGAPYLLLLLYRAERRMGLG